MWTFEEYSEWSRSLARLHTERQLRSLLAKAMREKDRAKGSHFLAVSGTTSMEGKSQRRAATRTTLVTLYERCRCLEEAIELHRLFPEMVRRPTT